MRPSPISGAQRSVRARPSSSVPPPQRPSRRQCRSAASRPAGTSNRGRQPTGDSRPNVPGKVQKGAGAPSWFPARAPEKIRIIFRRGVYAVKNTSQAASVENDRPKYWGGHFLRAVGLRFHSPKAALLPWVRKSLAEMFLGTFQRFKISMNSSPVMVSFS